MSTYQDTLDYLYAKLPMYNRIGAAAIKNNLDNTLAICSFLGNPEKNILVYILQVPMAKALLVIC